MGALQSRHPSPLPWPSPRGPSMLFAWLKQRRRRQLLATPFPDEWLTYLRNNVSLYAPLTEAEQAKLRDDLRVFVAERPWEGCGGLAVTDEMKVTVAAQACLLLMGQEHDYFRRVPSILVYPTGFQITDEHLQEAGWLPMAAGGQAVYRGPVILAWDAVLA